MGDLLKRCVEFENHIVRREIKQPVNLIVSIRTVAVAKPRKESRNGNALHFVPWIRVEEGSSFCEFVRLEIQYLFYTAKFEQDQEISQNLPVQSS